MSRVEYSTLPFLVSPGRSLVRGLFFCLYVTGTALVKAHRQGLRSSPRSVLPRQGAACHDWRRFRVLCGGCCLSHDARHVVTAVLVAFPLRLARADRQSP